MPFAFALREASVNEEGKLHNCRVVTARALSLSLSSLFFPSSVAFVDTVVRFLAESREIHSNNQGTNSPSGGKAIFPTRNREFGTGLGTTGMSN